MQNLKNDINKAYIELLIDGHMDKDKVDFRIKPDFNTASWSWTPPHTIVVGDKILENTDVAHNTSYYVGSFVNHEVAHSRFTERNIQSFDKELKRRNLKFQLWNIFEDARIEHLWREETSRNFKWLEYEPAVIQSDSISTLNAIVQADGNTGVSIEKNAERVANYYYPKIISAKHSWDLIPIMEEWKKEYGDNLDDENHLPDENEPKDEKDNQISSSRGQDMKFALHFSQNPDYQKEFLKGTVGISSEEPAGPKKESAEAGSCRIDSASKGSLISRHSSDYILRAIKEAGNLISSFEPLFRVTKGYSTSMSPQKRLNMKGIARGSIDRPFRKKTEEHPGQKDVVLILDLSGSMCGRSESAAATIIALFSRLSTKGLVKGHVILSGVKGQKSYWETYRFPIPDSTISQFRAIYDAEGIQDTIKNNIQMLKKADLVFCLTDGQITDAPIDRDSLSKQGISITGIYVGDDAHCNLSKWFAKGVARATIKEVADELLRKMR